MELFCHGWKAQESEKGKILLLHGMGGTGALWRPIASRLEKHWTLLAPDQRGHGKSQIQDTLATYTPEDYGKDLVDTVEKSGFSPCWVIGHSMGVRTACAFAYLKPKWIKGLVLIDLAFTGVAGGGIGDGLGHFLAKLPMKFKSRQNASDFMSHECPDPSISRYLMAVSVQLPPSSSHPGEITFPFDKEALLATIRAARGSSIRPWIESLGQQKIPVLVLRGESSPVWTHEEFEAEKIRCAVFPSLVFEEFPGAGHGLPFEKRIEFIERILQFMA